MHGPLPPPRTPGPGRGPRTPSAKATPVSPCPHPQPLPTVKLKTELGPQQARAGFAQRQGGVGGEAGEAGSPRLALPWQNQVPSSAGSRWLQRQGWFGRAGLLSTLPSPRPQILFLVPSAEPGEPSCASEYPAPLGSPRGGKWAHTRRGRVLRAAGRSRPCGERRHAIATPVYYWVL